MIPHPENNLQVGSDYRMRGADSETWITGTVLEGRLVLSWKEEDAGWVNPAGSSSR